MPVTKPISGQETSDIQKIIELLSRNYKLFIFSIVIALPIAFLANRYMPPQYKISASLLIKEDTKKQSGSVNEFLNSGLFGTNQNFQNELWVLKSTPVIEQTVRNLDLTVNYYLKEGFQYIDGYNKMPFKILILQNHVQPMNVRFNIEIHDKERFEIRAESKNVSLINFNTSEVISDKNNWTFVKKGKFGKLIETPDLAFIVQLDSTQKFYYKNEFIYSFILTDVKSLVDRLKKQIEFNVIDKMSTIIEIVYKSSSVDKGKDILNELMDVYSQQNLNQKNHTAGITVDYIEKQLGEISDSLSQTEDNLQTFRSSNQLLNVSEQSTGISAQYRDLQNQLAELITRKKYYDYVSENLYKNNDFSNMIVPSSMGITDQLLNNLMTELINAQAQRSNLIQNNQEQNPLVQKLGIQIENFKKSIAENISAVRKTTDISIDEMNKRIHKVESEISRLPKTQRQLGGIERKYRLNDAIYNYLLEKRAEAKITQASNLPDDLIIEPANMIGTKPVSPNTKLIYLTALLLGFIIPFGYLTLKSGLNNKIESQENLERLTNVPVIGKILHNHRKTNNVVFEFPKSSISEAYRALRTNLEFQFKGVKHKVILVTSCMEGEGKSFNALNLAMSYAQLGRRTILVDFDLRKPTGYFNKVQESLIGLSSWYTDRADLKDIILHSSNPKMDYIESGPIPPNPVELLATDKTESLITQLRTLYDCIVIDTTPLAQVSDAYLLVEHSDIKIMIVRYHYSLKKVFSLVMKDLEQKRLGNVCVLLNDNRVYIDQYGYGSGYGKKNG
jgi:tyrosine-protein kinase Etk/Wzc